jgi:radical SAM superfamily enzyme YgiQ (UPF0313 family)
MRVLLVNPPLVTTTAGYFEIPLGLAYLAASLENHGHEVHVLDLQIAPKDALHAALDLQPGVVGLPTTSYTVEQVGGLCQEVKARTPSSVIVLGGVRATFEPDEALTSAPDADLALRGESEETFAELCALLESGCALPELPAHISTCHLPRGRSRWQPETRPDIDALPLAVVGMRHWDLAACRLRNPAAPMLLSRGCHHRCAFCSSPTLWGRIRKRSWASVEPELRLLEEHSFGSINFVDDSFSLLGRPLLDPLLGWLGDHHIKWWCEARLDHLAPSLVDRFVAQGLERIRVSVETIHPRSLALLRKGVESPPSQAQVAELVRVCPEVQIAFMVGIPGETYRDVLETMDFAEGLRPARIKFWAFSVLPGTPIGDDPARFGIRTKLDPRNLDTRRSFIETTTLSNADINELLQIAWRRFG